MPDFLARIMDWLAMGFVQVAAISVAAAIALFAPATFISTIGMSDILITYRSYVGLAFLLSTTLLLVMAMKVSWDVFLGVYIRQALQLYSYRKDARDLTEDEKRVLRSFITEQTRAMNLSIQDGVVLGLQKRMIIVRIGDVGQSGFNFMFPFHIQPWAWEFFNKNPQLLDNDPLARKPLQ